MMLLSCPQVIQQALHRPPSSAAQYLQQMYAAQQQHLMLQTAALQQQHLSLASVPQVRWKSVRKELFGNKTIGPAKHNDRSVLTCW